MHDFAIEHDEQIVISIHALRMEGDLRVDRPKLEDCRFLSTPSGWRATTAPSIRPMPQAFLSTPSGWRATKSALDEVINALISIHALRVEGDSKNGQSFRLFLRKREKNLPL